MTETALAWAAGLFDGEGCVFIARQDRKDRPGAGYSLKLAVSMVHKPTLERFAAIVGGPISAHSKPAARARAAWQWQVYNDNALTVLKALMPFLVTKRVEAEIALGFENRPRTKYPKGGRSQEVLDALEGIRTALKAAKRYEWKHEAAVAQ